MFRPYQYDNIKTVSSARAIFDYIVQSNLYTNPHALKFVTLSVNDFPIEDLEWAFELSGRSFNNLRDRKITKKSIRQSIDILKQITPNKTDSGIWSLYGKTIKDVVTGGWRKTELEPDAKDIYKYNVHLHVLCECQYIPQPLLSVLWKSVLNKNWQGRRCYSEGIVHVQDVVNTKEDIIRVINYMAKPITISKGDRFRNLRLYSTFGSWYNRN